MTTPVARRVDAALAVPALRPAPGSRRAGRPRPCRSWPTPARTGCRRPTLRAPLRCFTRSCLTLSGSASGLSILLIAIDAAAPWRPRVIDRFDGLRHHAVVGGDHQHHDVGQLGAARAHRGERRMARGIEEGDDALLGLHVVRADMLGDAAGFAGGHLGAADVVQQRGLAVVDVTHDGDHRRTRGLFALLCLGLRNRVRLRRRRRCACSPCGRALRPPAPRCRGR